MTVSDVYMSFNIEMSNNGVCYRMVTVHLDTSEALA